MDKKLRERLVGSIVLISLAVIFLPELLKPPEKFSTTNVDSNIPPTPVIRDLPAPSEPIPVILKVPTGDVREGDRGKESPSDEEAIVGGTEHRSLDIPTDLRGWVVQVGTFAEEPNALRLRDELRASGYATYVEEVQGRGRTLYRVRVGPELEKSRAESALARIRDQFGLEPHLQRHP